MHTEMNTTQLWISFLFAALMAAVCPATAADKPNVIIFFADDLGYADIGVYGCQDIPTPHVDSIAEERRPVHRRLRHAPGLLAVAGRADERDVSAPVRLRAQFRAGALRPPTSACRDRCRRWPRSCKAAGYATGMVGKWHIGFKEGLRPHERGFDYYYGFLSGATTTRTIPASTTP